MNVSLAHPPSPARTHTYTHTHAHMHWKAAASKPHNYTLLNSHTHTHIKGVTLSVTISLFVLSLADTNIHEHTRSLTQPNTCMHTHTRSHTHTNTHGHTHTHGRQPLALSWIKEQRWSRGKKLFRQICSLTEEWEREEKKREEKWGQGKRDEGRKKNRREEKKKAVNKECTDLTEIKPPSLSLSLCGACNLVLLSCVWDFLFTCYCVCACRPGYKFLTYPIHYIIKALIKACVHHCFCS